MKKLYFTFCFAILLTTYSLQAQTGDDTDACSRTEKLSGGSNISGNRTQNIGNGYTAELWQENGNNGSMVYFGGDADCAFKASWNNSGDFMARVGYYDSNATKTYSDLGDIIAGFNYTKQGTAGTYSYIGVYGWTKSPLIEYYIVDDTFTPDGSGMLYGVSEIGSYTLDGETYKLYKGLRKNAYNIEGQSDFTQVFAVRSSARTCGYISVSEHFKKWEENDISLGKIYECQLLCETSGGNGSIEYTYASIAWKGQNGHGLTGIQETESDDDIIITPNLPGKFLTIKSKQHIKSIEIYNIAGQCVLKQGYSENVKTDFPRGTYIVKFTIKDGSTVVKKFNTSI